MSQQIVSPCGRWMAKPEILVVPENSTADKGPTAYYLHRKNDRGTWEPCRQAPYRPHELFGLPEDAGFGIYDPDQDAWKPSDLDAARKAGLI
jgi:hypothetical protein